MHILPDMTGGLSSVLDRVAVLSLIHIPQDIHRFFIKLQLGKYRLMFNYYSYSRQVCGNENYVEVKESRPKGVLQYG